MLPALFVTLYIAASMPLNAADVYILRGQVFDGETGLPLPSANIWIKATTRGTVANHEGRFHLPVSQGEYEIITSHIGYRSDTTLVRVPDNVTLNILLTPVPIRMPEVVITDEDPAIEIIRRAIANKPIWMRALESYIARSFTRDKLVMNTHINALSEAYSDLYWHNDRGLREIVTQRRQSANITDEFQLARMGEIINFNDDEIELMDFQFIGVTSPNALRHYDYRLIDIRQMDDITIYDIQVIPKTRLQPLFRGHISIAEGTYAVIEVDLTPNEAFHVPIIQQLNAHYQQQFRLYDGRFWMPSNFRFTAGFTVALPGWRLGDFVYQKSSVIYEYEINAEIPDTVFEGTGPFTIAQEAARFDSSFWAAHDVLPLTYDEIRAYERIDSLVTHRPERQRSAGRIESVLRPLQYIDARFNRVEGFYLGGKVNFDDLLTHVRFYGTVGYGFSDQEWKYNVGAVLYPSHRRVVGVGGAVYRETATIPREQHFGSLSVAAAALLDKKDYLDYYLAEGWRSFVELNFRRGPRYRRHTTRIEVGYKDEDHRSMMRNTNFSIFYQRRTFRENPVIDEGRLRVLSLHASRTPSTAFFLLPSGFRWEISMEYSSPAVTGSDFEFTRLFATVQGRINTMYRRHAFSPVLSYFIAAGTSSGTVPIQRMFELHSDLSGFATVGTLRGIHAKEFAGDQFVQLSLEHNFRRIPFLALGIPLLYELGLEFLVHGSIARSWMSTPIAPDRLYLPCPTDGWYLEFGFGLGKILELIRIDLTWRALPPRGIHVTFGVSELL